jgi:membrane protease YdiL (CAAX protease family)
MHADAATLPTSTPERLVWAAKRMLLWLVIFALLDAAGTLLFQWVPFSFSGPYITLYSSSTLIAALIAGILVLRWQDRRPPGALGFNLDRSAGTLSAVGLAIGAIVLLLVSVLMLIPGWLGFRPDDGSATGWLGTVARDFMLFGVAAAAEEAVFRGYGFQVLAKGTGPVIATAAGSALFAWAHASNPSVGSFALINIFLAGVLLSAAYLLTQSLWFATAVHLGWNWSMASLLDLPVSGLEIMDTPLYDATVRGPHWFTGGAFGPEGGLAGTMAFSGALLIVWWYARRRARVETA